MRLLYVSSDDMKSDLKTDIIVGDERVGKVSLSGDITRKAVTVVKAYLEDMIYSVKNKEKGFEDVNELFIEIYSSGGDLEAMLNLCDFIQRNSKKSLPISTIASGEVASAAVPVFICGHNRYTYKNTLFMIHEPSSTFEGVHSHNKAYMRISDIQIKRMWSLLTSRTKLSSAQLRKEFATNGEFWLTATDALKYKLATRILK